MGETARRTVAGGCAAIAMLLATAMPASARDQAITSFDGTKISTSFFPAAGLKAGERAPTVLQGHGWGLVRNRDADAGGEVGVGVLRRAGFNVLTWDARGFGESGGTIQVDSPDFEGRDVMALVDWVARQPEALLDGEGDPRVGMQGSSYAGAIELVAAGIDPRIDAIAPDIAWNSLTTALNREGLAKFGWGAALLGLGTTTGTTLGLFSPYGPETGTIPPELVQAGVDGIATGRFSDPVDAYLEGRNLSPLVERIRIPTLLTQGTPDTLFSPSEAMRNYEILRRNKVPVKMVWHCGGHGACLTGNQPSIGRAAIPWLKRWLFEDPSIDTGPRFEWVADDAVRRTALDFPLVPGPAVSAEGSGRILKTPVDTVSGVLIAATPGGLGTMSVPLPVPDTATDVVGEPEVTITYSGTGASTDDHVFAQLVDVDRNLVVGNQTTPIPVFLDGRVHTVTRRLEGIAVRMRPGSHYRLEIAGGSNVYGITRGLATIEVAKARVVMPTVNPAATPDRDALGLPAPKRCVSRRSFRLRLTPPRGERFRSVTVYVGKRKARTVRGKALRSARIDLRGLPKGTVRVKVVARTARGRTVEQVRRYRTCTAKKRR